MREIVLDTETTGLDAAGGDRIVEIGGVELVNHFPTRRTFHTYLNPERTVAPDAERVHGLSNAFLADKPRFVDCVTELIAFLGDARLVIHNASFDIGFLNAEFGRTGHPAIGLERVVDTLSLARRKHPGAQNSLDALCARYGIDNSSREKHGALLDAELLAEVYIELTGGRQTGLALDNVGFEQEAGGMSAALAVARRPVELASRLTEDERAKHAELIASIGEKAIWLSYRDPAEESRSG